MRQVNIKALRGRLAEELKDLPFEITKFGHVLGVVSTKSVHLSIKKPKKGVRNSKEVEEKLSEIIKKKKYTNKEESPLHVGGMPVLGYPKSYQARRKGK